MENVEEGVFSQPVRRSAVQRMLDSINDMKPEDREELTLKLLDASLDEAPEKQIESEPCSLYADFFDEIEAHDKSFGQMVGLGTGIKVVDDMTMGLAPGELTIVAAPTSVGKGEPLDNLIPTPNGFVRMGDIKVGDYVFGNNGKPTRVKGVFDKGVKQTYEVKFEDGCSVEVCKDHLWSVLTKRSAGHKKYVKEEVLDTEELFTISQEKKNKWFFGGRKKDKFCCYLPEQEAVEYTEKELPIHPYVLGGLLADGYLCGTSLQWTKTDSSIVERMNSFEPLVERVNPAQHGFKNSIILYKKLDKLGLKGKKSAEKFIPEQYLLGSIRQRELLLKGLLDGDGTVVKGNITMYSTTSDKLKDGVVELANSLGIITCASLINDAKRGKTDYWRIRIHLKDRSSDNSIKKRQYRQTHRKMIAITPKRKTEIRCIAVEAENELYLTSHNYIVTHNTMLCLNIAANLAVSGHVVGFITMEMTKPEIGARLKKIMGDQSGEMYNIIVNKSDKMSWKSVDMFIKRAIDDAGIEALFIDHLHYFSRSMDNSAEELGIITQEFKHLAIKYNIPIILISHTRKTDNMGQEREATMNDLRGSSFIAQDADIVLMLNRVWEQTDMGRVARSDATKICLEKNRNRFGVPVGTSFVLRRDGLKFDGHLTPEEQIAWNNNKPKPKTGFSQFNPVREPVAQPQSDSNSQKSDILETPTPQPKYEQASFDQSDLI